MPATVQRQCITPTQKVAALKHKLGARASGGCIYILSDELEVLVALALEGANAIERRDTLMALLHKQGQLLSA